MRPSIRHRPLRRYDRLVRSFFCWPCRALPTPPTHLRHRYRFRSAPAYRPTGRAAQSSCNVRPTVWLASAVGIGAADLTQHLLLADHRGVQTRCHREQMLDSGLGIADVGVLGQIAHRHTGVLSEHLTDHRKTAVECIDYRIDLDAVAGGQHHRFGHQRRIAAPDRRSWPARPRWWTAAPGPIPAHYGATPRIAGHSRGNLANPGMNRALTQHAPLPLNRCRTAVKSDFDGSRSPAPSPN